MHLHQWTCIGEQSRSATTACGQALSLIFRRSSATKPVKPWRRWPQWLHNQDVPQWISLSELNKDRYQAPRKWCKTHINFSWAQLSKHLPLGEGKGIPPKWCPGMLTVCPLPSLPLLKWLHYEYSCVGDDVGLFSGLHAPNLITLSLEAWSLSTTYSPTQDDSEDDIDRLLKYCATHLLFPKLQTLSLYNVNAAVNMFTLLMDTTPTLHVLCDQMYHAL